MDQGEDKLTIEMVNPIGSIEKIKSIPITSNRTGYGATLGQLAEVGYKLGRVKGQNFINGRPAISMGVDKDLVSDSIDLKKVVDKKIEQLNATAPDGMKFIPLVDGPQFIKRQIEVLNKNGLVGFILVVLILMLFLNWKNCSDDITGFTSSLFRYFYSSLYDGY